MIIKNLLYILQSENYDYYRFLKFVYRNPKWWNLEKRKKIDWTPKAKILWFVSIIILFILLIANTYFFKILGIFLNLLIIIFLPFIIIVSLFLIKPLDFYLKTKKIKTAKNIINEKNIITIGIAGSYGKTSVKEILYSILKRKYKVIKTPENINTDIGIANFIIENKKAINSANIIIVEMGAYKEGNILNICEMIKPRYSILTGISECHFERFGNMDNIIKTKFELPCATLKTSFLNFDDQNIRNNYKKFNINNYFKTSINSVKNIKTKKNFLGLNFEYNNLKYSTKLLAKHSISNILPCIELAKKVNIDIDKISRGVASAPFVKHRLEPIFNYNTNITVIDDSYNGNFNGIKSGLEVLKDSKKRKIILTPGLAELGKESKKIHFKIGQLYSEHADLILLIKSHATKFILHGMKHSAKCPRYIIYKNVKEAHNNLKNILKAGDTIIFQNDLSDIYN